MPKRISAPPSIELSTGNVFADLGLPDADTRLAKAQLARIIRLTIRERGWTQKDAAAKLGIAAPDMSDLMRGKLARFSEERLERFLNTLGFDIRIQVIPKPAKKRQADITVELLPAVQV